MTHNNSIHIAIVGNSRLVREAIALRLAREERLEPVAAAATPRDLLRRARTRPVDVLLVHCTGDAEEAVQTIRDAKALLGAPVRVIVLGDAENASNVVRWMEAGAVACLEEDAPCSRLVDTIRAVADGRVVVPPKTLGQVLRRIGERVEANRHAQHEGPDLLSAREAQVAELVACGLPNKQIAKRLDVKLATVKGHVHNLMAKLQVRRRRDVVRGADAQELLKEAQVVSGYPEGDRTVQDVLTP